MYLYLCICILLIPRNDVIFVLEVSWVVHLRERHARVRASVMVHQRGQSGQWANVGGVGFVLKWVALLISEEIPEWYV